MAAKKKLDFTLPRPTQPCAVDTCKTPAILREETPTGWANFCEHHYIRYHRERAMLACQENGLTDKLKQREFVRKFMPNVVPKPVSGS